MDVPCDHAAQAPAVLAAREHESASVSVHRQTLDLPVAPQTQGRTVQTVKVIGDSTVQFLGEVADALVVVQRLVPMGSRQRRKLFEGPTVEKTMEIPHLRVMDVAALTQRQVPAASGRCLSVRLKRFFWAFLRHFSHPARVDVSAHFSALECSQLRELEGSGSGADARRLTPWCQATVEINCKPG